MISFAVIEKNGLLEKITLQELEKHFHSSKFVWVDFENPSNDDLSLVNRLVPLHPLTVEGIISLNRRAKVREFDEYLFIVAHSALYDGLKIKPIELDIVAGRNFLISFHKQPLEGISEAEKEVLKKPDLAKKNPSHVLYLLLESTTESLFSAAEDITEAVEKLEDDILSHPNKKVLAKLFSLKKNVVALRKVVLPQREVLNFLYHHQNSFIDKSRAVYFRDLYDNLVRVSEFIETSREIISDSFDAYLSVVSNRLNEIMKVLTIISTIILPMGLVVGYYGMNVSFAEYGIFGQQGTQFFALGLVFLIAVSMLFWFRSKKWL